MFRLARLLVSSILVLCSFVPVLAAAAVGRTEGAFAVTATGGASYTIPLWTPPGTHGVEPQLALRYDSEAGAGYLGPGWFLGGLPRITRCVGTYVQDTVPSALTLTADDKFCLNGKRLRLTSGVYGSAASTYQTEIADFSNTTAYGVAGNGPAYFIVRTRDGLTYEYGNTADSRVSATGTSTPYAWTLNKLYDRQGNALVVTYTQSNGSAVPASIQYARSSAGSSSFNNEITFSYSTTALIDAENNYVSGGSIYDANQLLTVTARTNGALVRRYNLSYAASPTTGRQRLASVEECAGASGTECLAPTVVSYLSAQAGVAAPITPLNIGQFSDSIFLDVNADGRQDFVYSAPLTATAPKGIYVLFATATGFAAPVSTGIDPLFTDPVLYDDFDGDGDIEMLWGHTGGSWIAYSWNGTAFAATATGLALDTGRPSHRFDFATADVNGDGLPDLVSFRTDKKVYERLNASSGGSIAFASTVTMRYDVPAQNFGQTLDVTSSQLAGNNDHSRFMRTTTTNRLDFNGDGREDVVFYATGVGTFSLLSGATQYLKGYFNFDGTPLDWNGDGCTDFATIGATSYIYISACDGTAFIDVVTVAGPGATAYGDGTAALDWDGDGRMDLVGYKNGYLAVVRSLGRSAASPVNTSTTLGSYAWLAPYDHEGDGLHDLMRYEAYDSPLTFGLHNSAGVPVDRVASVTDGFGVSVAFSYASIAQNNYSKYADGGYPNRDYVGPLPVVSQLSATDGAGGNYSQSFWYYGARVNMQGRGFDGFYAKRTIDSRNSLQSFQYFRRDFPYVGQVFQADLYQANGSTLVRRIVNSLTATTLNATTNQQRYLPYANQTTQSDYEFGGAYNGSQLRTTVTANTVDSWGTLIDQTATTTEVGTGLNPGAVHTRRTTLTGVINDTANWCLGKPAQTQQINSHTLAGGAQVTRTTSSTWDYFNCRLTQEIAEPGNTQWQATTDLGYEGFGNINATTVTPAAGQGQAARTTSIDWGVTGQFPTTVVNEKGHTSIFSWNLPLGVRTGITDPNNLTTSWQYDNFGRKTRQQQPDGTATDYSLIACGTPGCYGPYVTMRTYVQEVARDTANTEIARGYHYLDEFDREIGTQSQILGGGYSVQRRAFNAIGQLYQASTPHLASDTIWYTTYSYDALGRLTLVRRPSSEADTSNHDTQFAYQGLSVTQTDALSHSNARKFDAAGHVLQAIDSAGNDTDYEYDAFGNLLKVRDVLGNETTLTYNVRGMKMTSSDPDMGGWSYSYFPLGELKSQTDAKAQTTTFTYDELSRPLTRVESEATTTWTWDTATKGIGQLAAAAYGASYIETHAFDSYGRPSQLLATMDSVTYQYDYTYQSTTGLLDTITYPVSIGTERFKIRYGYQYGLVASVQSYINDVAGTTYWQSLGMNARGQTVLEQFGNGLQTSSGYDRITGLLDDTLTGPSASGTIQNLAYSWDKAGNLSERRDLNQSLTEHFYYDSLDRLDYSTLNGVTNLDVTYNAIGNITYKSDVGSYTYHATRKHAVTSTSGLINNTYGYDANGNMSSRNGSTTTWASYNYPTRIFLNSNTRTDFKYTHDRKLRYQQIYTAGNVEEWWYVGGLFEKRKIGSTYEYRHIINGPAGPIAVRKRIGSGSSVWYLGPDHLGSTNAVTNSAGAAVVNESYEAFGERRGSNWTGVPSSADNTQINTSTKHGFTFHENLTNLNLIHMQGRVFDPVIGRFMSPDPYVQAPLNSQSLNRYSYTLNNPLSYTDPSGFDAVDLCDQSGCPTVVTGYGNDWLAVAPMTADDIDLPVFDGLGSGGGFATGSGFDSGGSNSGVAQTSESTVGGLGQGFLNAVPGAYYAGQSQVAWQQGRYVEGGFLYAGAIVDAGFAVFTLGESSAILGAVRATATRGTAALTERAAQIHGVLDPIAQARRTTAVLQTNAGRIIAGGARDLSPAQRALLTSGEIAARLPGAHAEVTALSAAKQLGLTPNEMAVTWTICPQCASAIEASGGTLTSTTTAIWP